MVCPVISWREGKDVSKCFPSKGCCSAHGDFTLVLHRQLGLHWYQQDPNGAFKCAALVLPVWVSVYLFCFMPLIFHSFWVMFSILLSLGQKKCFYFLFDCGDHYSVCSLREEDWDIATVWTSITRPVLHRWEAWMDVHVRVSWSALACVCVTSRLGVVGWELLSCACQGFVFWGYF